MEATSVRSFIAGLSVLPDKLVLLLPDIQKIRSEE